MALPAIAVVFSLGACGGDGAETVDVTADPAAPTAQPATVVVPTPAVAGSLDDVLSSITGDAAPYDPATVDQPCVEPARGSYAVPSDFAIGYVIEQPQGALGMTRRLTVDPSGQYRLTELQAPPPGSLDPPLERSLREGTVSGAAMRNLFAAVLLCDFFGLHGPYFDPSLLEGSTEGVRQVSAQTLTVRMNGHSHRVVIRNVPVRRFVTIRTTLLVETGGV